MATQEELQVTLDKLLMLRGEYSKMALGRAAIGKNGEDVIGEWREQVK